MSAPNFSTASSSNTSLAFPSEKVPKLLKRSSIEVRPPSLSRISMARSCEFMAAFDCPLTLTVGVAV